MNKFNFVSTILKPPIIYTLLLGVMLTNGYGYLIPEQAVAEPVADQEIVPDDHYNRRPKKDNNQTPESNLRAKNSILESIWKLLRAKREQEPALSSRTYTTVCEISPGLLGNVNNIYSDRPLFLWRGNSPQLKINLYTPFDLDQEQKILWSKTATGDEQAIAYTGKPLEVGKIYDWEIVTNPEANRRRISFRIIDGQKRDRISQDLAKLKQDLSLAGASTEEIVLAKANYFAEQDLWSDVLEQLFSIKNPSSLVSSNARKMVEYVCE